ncbi:hypothetical protein K435DRAFT_876564 [Dendrothele bispora CBS 962.96]|uniref:Ubiquitin-like protease family profile domain-containing protein n=1 Tax=Dendrothele bispora (strain CBS 962.96) TaxID=1314807 RepID=A0A4S8KRV7_DENBC|nr:hypothetical protein K435DRAFT_876564 [Dendrothele bispora CBS 962.96]
MAAPIRSPSMFILDSGCSLGTYWANKFLFDDTACSKPRSTFDNNSKVANDLKRSIRKKEKDLNITRWSKVFVPIHNTEEAHWYCASIDFEQRTIEILDSWAPTFRANQDKPLRQKKHTAVLAALMWVTERIAEYRGETVVLARNPNTDWVCSPHVEVPLQLNSYDCGVHVLWHLYHIVNFGRIKRNPDLPIQYQFTDNMVGPASSNAEPQLERGKKPRKGAASPKVSVLGDTLTLFSRAHSSPPPSESSASAASKAKASLKIGPPRNVKKAKQTSVAVICCVGLDNTKTNTTKVSLYRYTI